MGDARQDRGPEGVPEREWRPARERETASSKQCLAEVVVARNVRGDASPTNREGQCLAIVDLSGQGDACLKQLLSLGERTLHRGQVTSARHESRAQGRCDLCGDR